MKALLDTHVLLWAMAEPDKLSLRVRELYRGPAELYFSVAGLWEILIKAGIGKLPLPAPSGPYLVKKLSESKITVLPITLDHVLKVESLPPHHRDPFDRMLIAQSLVENLQLISNDPVFEKYPVKLIWQ